MSGGRGPRRSVRRGPPGRDDAAVRALVESSSDDPLAPYVLRAGKRHVFSPDGRAAVAFRVQFGTAVVGGDPVGDRLSWPSAIDEFIREADELGCRVAVLAAGEEARDLWVAHGLAAVPIGRDVVVHPDDFTLRGRGFRNLRQAVQRTRNRGVTTRQWLERDVPADSRAQIEQLLRAAGRDHDRGFSMILGRPFAGDQPESLIVAAFDSSGDLVGAQRYLRAGSKDLSLDVPVRAHHSPNGVDERLIADAVRWAGEHGIARVSLAFAPFPDLFDNRSASVRTWVLAQVVHVIDPMIKVERLYRYLRKFHAFDQERFVMLRWRQVVPVALALFVLEFSRR